MQIEAEYRPQTGDTLVAGRPFSGERGVAEGYASRESWFVANEPVHFSSVRYIKLGRPRRFAPGSLRRVGEYRGVGVYAEAQRTVPWGALYIPTGPGCEFQPYQSDSPAEGLRGG